MSARAVLDRYATWINRHDFDLLVPLLSEDCVFWFSSGTHRGIDAARAAFEKTWGWILDETYSVRDVQWLVETPESAVCLYTFHWSGLIQGQPASGTGRGTSVFRTEAGQWKLVHEHLSPFPKPSS